MNGGSINVILDLEGGAKRLRVAEDEQEGDADDDTEEAENVIGRFGKDFTKQVRLLKGLESDDRSSPR